jgi:acyl-coenzyme A synthetase/AMP-(fatty) acid ligase
LPFYAAALPRTAWDQLEALSLKVLGRKVPFVSSWGLTETAPSVTVVHFALDGPGNIGVPGPGNAVKLVPDADKLEIRVKGPNVTPGYFKAPELTAQLFDDEGWLRTGEPESADWLRFSRSRVSVSRETGLPGPWAPRCRALCARERGAGPATS